VLVILLTCLCELGNGANGKGLGGLCKTKAKIKR